jgi:hypothetical protein
MPLPNIVKLKKLNINAYSDPERKKLLGTFKAMYNPESFSQKYEIGYSVSTTSNKIEYSREKPQELNLHLVLDGTHVEVLGVEQIAAQKSVSQRLKDFFKWTFEMNGSIHEPNFLRVIWGGEHNGGLDFDCRLLSANVTYTSFERDGSPLRAELDIVLISDTEVVKRAAIARKNSPDLTHLRLVKSGDTLPLLCQEIYGSTHHYLRIAEFNQLNNFRNLTPGQMLRFPPLDQ